MRLAGRENKKEEKSGTRGGKREQRHQGSATQPLSKNESKIYRSKKRKKSRDER